MWEYGTSGGFRKIMRISYSKCRIKIIYPILSVQLLAISNAHIFFFGSINHNFKFNKKNQIHRILQLVEHKLKH